MIPFSQPETSGALRDAIYEPLTQDLSEWAAATEHGDFRRSINLHQTRLAYHVRQ